MDCKKKVTIVRIGMSRRGVVPTASLKRAILVTALALTADKDVKFELVDNKKATEPNTRNPNFKIFKLYLGGNVVISSMHPKDTVLNTANEIIQLAKQAHQIA